MEKKFFELFKSLDDMDEKSMKYLSAAIEKNNLKGFDYFEFKKSVHTLKDMLDEETAIKSAFATAANMGLTKERLMQSIDHYKNVLTKEKRQFDDALKKQINQKISSKREEKLQLKEHIITLNHKIQEINKKIASFQERIDNSDAEIKEAEEKIKSTQSNFEQAYNNFLSEINTDLDKINSVL